MMGPTATSSGRPTGRRRGPSLVADINPGSTTDYYGDVTPYSSYPCNLTALNGLLFFVGQ